jgi:hypothetical protein
VTTRKSVILSHAERRNLRRKLKGSIQVAQDVLDPRTQLKRVIYRRRVEVKRAVSNTANIVRKNAAVLSVVGIGALLFAVRRPISNWISLLQKSKHT